MKKTFTLFASLILTIAVFAEARPKSSLTVQSADRSDIRVIIDGRRFEPNNSSLRVQGIEAGYHQVKIYRAKSNGVFNILGKRYEVVFNSSINVKPRSNMLITVDRSGRSVVTDNRNNGRDRNDRDWANGRDFDYDRVPSYGDYNNDRGGRWGDYDNHYGYESPVSDREFDRIFQSAQREWLESDKLKITTQAVTANRVSSAQVKQLMQLFSFESNKLQLAKQAYANTVDKRNYSLINDAFSFNSSKDELARFIRNFR